MKSQLHSLTSPWTQIKGRSHPDAAAGLPFVVRRGSGEVLEGFPLVGAGPNLHFTEVRCIDVVPMPKAQPRLVAGRGYIERRTNKTAILVLAVIAIQDGGGQLGPMKRWSANWHSDLPGTVGYRPTFPLVGSLKAFDSAGKELFHRPGAQLQLIDVPARGNVDIAAIVIG